MVCIVLICMETGVGVIIFFFQAEDGIRVGHVTGVQTCALPISNGNAMAGSAITKVQPISRRVERRTCERSSVRYRHQTTPQSVTPSTTPGRSPPVNRAAIETPVTEP